MYLVSSPVNARRLMDLVARLEQRIHKAEAVSFIQKRFKCFWIKETALDMGDDSMYMSLLNVIPVARLDSGRWGFP